MKTGLLIGGFLMAALPGCALYKTEEKPIHTLIIIMMKNSIILSQYL